MDINMHKAFNYRLYPTKSQRSMMNRTLGLCRWTYNQTLAYRKNAYERKADEYPSMQIIISSPPGKSISQN